jgi:hypothetical protein
MSAVRAWSGRSASPSEVGCSPRWGCKRTSVLAYHDGRVGAKYRPDPSFFSIRPVFHRIDGQRRGPSTRQKRRARTVPVSAAQHSILSKIPLRSTSFRGGSNGANDQSSIFFCIARNPSVEMEFRRDVIGGCLCSNVANRDISATVQVITYLRRTMAVFRTFHDLHRPGGKGD